MAINDDPTQITRSKVLALLRTQYPSGNVPSLSGLLAPIGPVHFESQPAIDFVVENRTSDPGSPETGRLWLRTDL